MNMTPFAILDNRLYKSASDDKNLAEAIGGGIGGTAGAVGGGALGGYAGLVAYMRKHIGKNGIRVKGKRPAGAIALLEALKAIGLTGGGMAVGGTGGALAGNKVGEIAGNHIAGAGKGLIEGLS